MNAPFRVAQAATGQNAPTQPRVVKLTKPADGQSITIQMDGSVKLDFSAIANENITLVRGVKPVAERLTILFDNKSIIIIEPFFDSSGKPLQMGGIELEPGRIVSAEEFASLFPITEDQSVLVGAGEGEPQNTGGQFAGPSVDPLASPNPLPLLGQEELGNWVSVVEVRPLNDLLPAEGPADGGGPPPPEVDAIAVSGAFEGTVEEEHINPNLLGAFALLSNGNEDEDDTDSLDTDVDDTPGPENFGAVQHTVDGFFNVTGGTGFYTYAFAADLNNDPVLLTIGDAMTSIGEPVLYWQFDADTLIGYVDSFDGEGYQLGDRVVFALDIDAADLDPLKDFTFTLYDQIDHHPNSAFPVADDLEDNLSVDLNGKVIVSSGAQSLALNGSIAIIDDIPILLSFEEGEFNTDTQTATGIIQFKVGADEPGEFAITGFPVIPGVTTEIEQVGDDLVLTATIDATGDDEGPDENDDVFYTFTYDTVTGQYVFQLVNPLPGTPPETFSEDAFAPGPPVETITATAGGTTVTFDGLLFPTADVNNPSNPGGASTDDDLNPNGLGFGVRGGQASNINDLEGFSATFSNDLTAFSFGIDQTGNTTQTTIVWRALLNDVEVDTGTDLITGLPQGPGVVPYTITPSGAFDEVVVMFDHPSQNDSVRIQSFSLTRPGGDNDLNFQFEVTRFDEDGDKVAQTVSVEVTPPPTYALTGAPDAPDVAEGSDLIFTLSLSEASGTATVFKLATTNGTAIGGSDFETSGFEYFNGVSLEPASGAGNDEVTVAAGQTSIQVRVNTTDDLLDEPNNENMQLVVASVVSGTVAAGGNDGTETGLIDDNDATPVVSISNGTTTAALANVAAPVYSEVQEGNFIYFQVKLDIVSPVNVTVQLDTIDDDTGNDSPGENNSATEGSADYELSGFDYSTDGGSNWFAATGAGFDEVTLPAGTTSILVGLNTVEDATEIGDNDVEAFRLQIVAVTAGSAIIAAGDAAANGFAGTGEGAIIDDDGAPQLGGATANVNLNENLTLVTDLNATDPDAGATLTYSIVNTAGTDFDKFAVDANTGVLTFLSAPNFEAANDIGGTDNDNAYVVTVQVSDGQHTDTQTITVNVQDVNEQPSAGADIVVSAAENVNATAVLATVTGTDPDIEGGNDVDNTFENLSYAIQTDPSGKFEINSSGQISLISGQSLDFETAQQHVLTVRVSDGPGVFDDVQVTINVTNVNEVPTTDLNGGTGGDDAAATFLEEGGAISIGTAAATIADDGTTLASMTVTLTNRLDGNAVESLSLDGTASTAATGAGLVVGYTAATGVLLITGSASIATYQTILRGVLYNNTDPVLNTTPRLINVTVSDGLLSSEVNTSTITVTPVNDAPSGNNATITINEDATHTFTAANFGFTDPIDSPANTLSGVRITTLPANGVLELSGTPIIANQLITAATIGNLVFVPYPNENGAGYASFTFQVVDNGGTADGGVDTDPTPNTITFNVDAVNDAPVIWVPSVFEYAGSDSDDIPLNILKFSDADTTGTVTVTISSSDTDADIDAVDGDGGGGAVDVTGAGDGNVTFSATIAALNAFFAAGLVTYQKNDNSGDTVTVAINDGAGGTDSDTLTVEDETPSFNAGLNTFNFPDSDVFNVNTTSFDALGNGDTIVTAWSHVNATATTYIGGDGTDTIRAVFSADQLNEVLGSSLATVRDFYDGTPVGMNLGASSWNAIIDTTWETAQLGIAAPRVVDFGGVGAQDNYIPLDTWATVIGTGNQVAISGTVGATIYGTAGSDIMVGGAANQTLNGDANNDVLVAFHTAANTLNGGIDNDLLLGGDGGDTLNGGDGIDILAGGKGADTFAASSTPIAGNVDTIVDYDFTEGDKIDLSALLDDNFGPGDNPADFARLQQTGNNVTIQVDTDGLTGGANWADVAVLAGYGTNGADIVKVVFESVEHTLTA